MQLRIMKQLVFIFLTLVGVVFLLSWWHVLPGGFFLRNLLEEPGQREQRLRREHRRERLVEFAAESRRGLKSEGAVLLLGSSTMERFPRDLLRTRRPVLNRGIGDESSLELLGRLHLTLEDQEWNRLAGIVLYSGSIDFRRLGVSVDEVARRVTWLVRALRNRAPGASILLLGVLPGRREGGRSSGVALKALNRALGETAEELGLFFLDPGSPPLVDERGCLSGVMSSDAWHLNHRGYEVLLGRLKEIPGLGALFQ